MDELAEIGQRARFAGLALSVAALLLIAITSILAIALRDALVLTPLPAIVLLLLSLSFQQYSETTVIGVAREREYYEEHVAPIRKQPPLVAGVRLLQALSAAIVIATVVTGTVFAFCEAPLRAAVADAVVTAACLLSTLVSYRDMLRSYDVARSALSK